MDGNEAACTGRPNMIGCPKGERPWVAYYGCGYSLAFFVTSKTGSRDIYYLYEVSDGTAKRIGKSKSPRELEEKFQVCEKIRGSP